jgi:serine/threonine protein kinase
VIKTHPETLGRYQLLALLATGGMAEIYLARQTGIQGFNRLVVVKRVLPHLARDSSFLEMFFDEARIAAHLNHPNIVQIFDLGNEDEQYFIAMEYLEGESLAYLVSEANKTGKTMPHEIASGIISQICDGLGYAHKLCDEHGTPMNIVHRDINPQNIIVMFTGQVKLVDFGIAKAAMQEHETTVGTLKGKISYMSPEQCRCESLEASSDVFSLGVLFWELLTHTRLFKRQNEVETISAINEGNIPSVRQLQSDVPAELEAIVACALQRDPANRYANAAEMGNALRKVIRTRGEETSKEEIASFAEKVFGDRARTKRRLLDEIRRSNGGQITLGLLKPDTNESIPGSSKFTEPFFIDSDSSFLSLSLAIPRRFPIVTWIVLPILLAIGVGVWWFVSDLRSNLDEAQATNMVSMPPKDNHESNALEEPSTAGNHSPLGLVLASNVPPADIGNTNSDQRGPPKTELSVITTPSGCKVRIDRIELANLSPIEKLKVDPEVDHVVDVMCPKCQKETKSFKPKVGEHVTLAFSPPAVNPPVVVAMGLLRLNTNPWSEVYLNKKQLGVTPLMDVKLPAGKHSLTLVNSEHGLKKTVQIAIDAGKTSNLYLELK